MEARYNKNVRIVGTSKKNIGDVSWPDGTENIYYLP